MFQLADHHRRSDPYAMAEEMGNSLLAEWRAFFKMERDRGLQEEAATRAESGVQHRRR
jgi:hypothetical protein